MTVPLISDASKFMRDLFDGLITIKRRQPRLRHALSQRESNPADFMRARCRCLRLGMHRKPASRRSLRTPIWCFDLGNSLLLPAPAEQTQSDEAGGEERQCWRGGWSNCRIVKSEPVAATDHLIK